jgi:cytochrome c biogenesis protein CcmG/thiol:disulfide interchange protein DsbE
MSRSSRIAARPAARTRAGHGRWYLASAAVVAVALAVGIVAAGGDDSAGTASSQDVPPAASFEMIDGTSGSLADYRGRPVVVNFFASWCAPCLAEMPGFERVHQDLDGRVAFLGVNLQDRREDGLAVIEQTGITYDVARDPDGSLFQAFGAFAMPTTLFIDADGNVVDLHSGEISAGALAGKIDDVLLS